MTTIQIIHLIFTGALTIALGICVSLLVNLVRSESQRRIEITRELERQQNNLHERVKLLGTDVGNLESIAAQKTQEYIASGNQLCGECSTWKPAAAFADDYEYVCKECRGTVLSDLMEELDNA